LINRVKVNREWSNKKSKETANSTNLSFKLTNNITEFLMRMILTTWPPTSTRTSCTTQSIPSNGTKKSTIELKKSRTRSKSKRILCCLKRRPRKMQRERQSKRRLRRLRREESSWRSSRGRRRSAILQTPRRPSTSANSMAVSKTWKWSNSTPNMPDTQSSCNKNSTTQPKNSSNSKLMRLRMLPTVSIKIKRKELSQLPRPLILMSSMRILHSRLMRRGCTRSTTMSGRRRLPRRPRNSKKKCKTKKKTHKSPTRKLSTLPNCTRT